MDHKPSTRDELDLAEGTIELTVIVPTFNERDNIVPLLDRLEACLSGIDWEVIFVDDDSADGTAGVVRRIAQQRSHVRVIHRIDRRGLASACVEGVLSSSAPYFAVLDADMQHDETILPSMLETLKADDLDVVVGSRYVDGGGLGEIAERRKFISRAATKVAGLVVRGDLKDPMSGFFVMRREAFNGAARNLSQQGFKILLDVFASAPQPLRFVELPYEFRSRIHGASKLDSMVAWEYGMLLADKLFGRFIPPRLILFGAVGSLGLLVHMSVLATALTAGLQFALAQTVAVVAAMTFNFTLNNLITYRDQRLTGWAWLRGLISFCVICSVGAVANVGIATYVYANEPIWWFAGLAGALVGAVWNYALSGFFTWKNR